MPGDENHAAGHLPRRERLVDHRTDPRQHGRIESDLGGRRRRQGGQRLPAQQHQHGHRPADENPTQP